jgi:hypothetical protein
MFEPEGELSHVRLETIASREDSIIVQGGTNFETQIIHE